MSVRARSSGDAASRPAWVGWTAAAALILVVGIWAYMALVSPRTAAEEERRALPADAPDSPRARSDMWFLPDDELLGFVEIAAGQFLMGSDRAIDRLAFDNERWSAGQAQGIVNLPQYYIGRYEVTVRQFGAYAKDSGHRIDENALRAPPAHPVTMVSWPDALAYCRWLETKLKESPATPPRLSQLLRDGWRIGLSSEAQWEKAARGADGRIFPWGNEPKRDRANYGGTGTTPVGSFSCPECPFGLSDMSGNVWEWTRSPYQPYPFDPADDRQNLTADALWVMRGGSFADTEQNIRAALRGGADPGARRPFIGFRIVLYAGGQTGVRHLSDPTVFFLSAFSSHKR